MAVARICEIMLEVKEVEGCWEDGDPLSLTERLCYRHCLNKNSNISEPWEALTRKTAISHRKQPATS